MQTKTRLQQASTLADEYPVSIESDPYICMSVWIGQSSVASGHLYWRLVDDLSVVEIGIEGSTGRLASVQVVLYNTSLSPIGPELKESDLTRGVPEFRLDLWTPPTDVYDYGKYLCTVPGSSQLELGKSKLRIRLFPDERVYGVMTLDQITCEFNKRGELCAILIDRLNNKVMQNLKKFLEER